MPVPGMGADLLHRYTKSDLSIFDWEPSLPMLLAPLVVALGAVSLWLSRRWFNW